MKRASLPCLGKSYSTTSLLSEQCGPPLFLCDYKVHLTHDVFNSLGLHVLYTVND